jgi:hypothetical protein
LDFAEVVNAHDRHLARDMMGLVFAQVVMGTHPDPERPKAKCLPKTLFVTSLFLPHSLFRL